MFAPLIYYTNFLLFNIVQNLNRHHIINLIWSLYWRYTNFFQDQRLNAIPFRKMSVQTEIECIVKCVKEPCCRSTNFRKKFSQSHKSQCEMLHGVHSDLHGKSLIKSQLYNYIFFNEPVKVRKSIKSCLHNVLLHLFFNYMEWQVETFNNQMIIIITPWIKGPY